jgi:hypothetical protein
MHEAPTLQAAPRQIALRESNISADTDRRAPRQRLMYVPVRPSNEEVLSALDVVFARPSRIAGDRRPATMPPMITPGQGRG